MIKVIGHRGAKALAPENTIAGIKAGIAAGVDGIEFDIKMTKDKQFVLSHDDSLLRLWNINAKISELDFQQLKKLTTKAGRTIETLSDALENIGDTPAIIEAKGDGWARLLANYLHNHPKKSLCTVIAYNHRELFIFGQNCPNVPLYGLERFNSAEALNNARIFGFDGIDLNFLGLNPLVYWLARRRKLSVVAYNINYVWLAKMLRFLYPSLIMTTNIPHKLQFLRPRRLRVKHGTHQLPRIHRRK